MNRLLLLILPLSLACQPHASNTDVNNKDSSTTIRTNAKTDVVDTSKKVNLEYFDWNLATINNQVPVLCKKERLVEIIGQPDSIVTPNMEDICVSYFDKNIQFMYFGKSQFEISGDSAVISSIHFDNTSKISLNIGSLILDNSLTLTKLTTLFPNSVQLKEEVTIENGVRVTIVQLAESKKTSDFFWTLFFLEGRLIRIDYGMTC